MRDPRLRQEGAAGTDDERREAASLRLAAISSDVRADIDRVLKEWWAELLAQEDADDPWETASVERLRTACSSLPSESRKLGLAVADALSPDATSDGRGVGEVLLGESAATAVRHESSVVALDRAVTFLSRSWEAVDALMEALLRAPSWPASTEVLDVTAIPVDNLVCRGIRPVPSSDVLSSDEVDARAQGVVAYFWDDYPELELKEAALVRIMLAAQGDAASAVLRADALPLRALRDNLFLRLHLHEDRDSILAMLGSSPPVFADEKWTGHTGALVALREAIRHAERLHEHLVRAMRSYDPSPDAAAKLQEFEGEELPAWLRQVAQACLARSDGRHLLLLFASNLIREGLLSRSSSPSWSPSDCALCATCDVLDPKPSVDELRRVASSGGIPHPRTTPDHATYLMASATFEANPNDVWAWYRDLLSKNDADLCSQTATWRRGGCYRALADRLGQLADPFEEWRDVWKRLFVTDRERARFATLDSNALYPSLHLLRVGAELLRQFPARTGERPFFEELLAHTRGLLANAPRSATSVRSEVIFDLLDVAPRVLDADWPQVLEPYRSLLASAPNRLRVATLLLEGGASFSDVEAAVERAPHRLRHTVDELANDPAFRRSCAIILEAAEQHERSSAEGPRTHDPAVFTPSKSQHDHAHETTDRQ